MDSIIVTDLDGTFVKDSVSVAKADTEKMKQLQEQMHAGVATGRSAKEIRYIEEQTGIKFDVKISFNGAIVESFGKIIADTPLEETLKNQIIAFLVEHKIKFDALDGQERIGTFSSENSARTWNMTFHLPKNVIETLANTRVYKINIRPNKDACDDVLARLKADFTQVEICKSGPERIEITPKNVTKGQAIELIRQKQGLHVIAVGDSENDIDMLKHADYAICISTAADEVKASADSIVDNFYNINL